MCFRSRGSKAIKTDPFSAAGGVPNGTYIDGNIERDVENLGVKLLIDPISVQYLTGAEIDYREGLDGAQFVIRNPNAQTTCGCGSSFSA